MDPAEERVGARRVRDLEVPRRRSRRRASEPDAQDRRVEVDGRSD